MTIFRWVITLLLVLLCSVPVQAEGINEGQFGAIKKLGELNGVALHCRFLSETQRMKKALVLTLPKRRQYGEAFDTETNAAFLRFIEAKASCPEEAAFSKQVDEAILVLDSVFADK